MKPWLGLKKRMKYDKKNNLGLEYVAFYVDRELLSLNQENNI